MIEAVVFDMDGVLSHHRRERRLALLASWSGRSPGAIHAAIWGSGFEDEAERGLVSVDDYLKGFGERLRCPLTAAEWVEARKATTEPDLAMLALARQLAILDFDDDANYVAGAREAGLSAYRVGGVEGVRAGLAAHGLGVV